MQNHQITFDTHKNFNSKKGGNRAGQGAMTQQSVNFILEFMQFAIKSLKLWITVKRLKADTPSKADTDTASWQASVYL